MGLFKKKVKSYGTPHRFGDFMPPEKKAKEDLLHGQKMIAEERKERVSKPKGGRGKRAWKSFRKGAKSFRKGLKSGADALHKYNADRERRWSKDDSSGGFGFSSGLLSGNDDRPKKKRVKARRVIIKEYR